MKKRYKLNLPKILILLVVFAVLVVYLSRHFGAKELDDVTPGIPCAEDVMQKSDIFWVIPDFGNQSIANNTKWCQQILAMNKTLELHGVHHTYNEFGSDRNITYVNIGVNDFESCFNETPREFKAPQLNLSKENKLVLENNGFKVKGKVNQFFHKVYHCNDTGRFSNKFIDRF